MAVGRPIRAQTFRRIQLGDQIANRMQDSLQGVSGFLESIPFLDGTLIEGVTVTALTTVNVQHKLNRKYRGWITLKTTAREAGRCIAYKSSNQAVSSASNVTVTLDSVEYDPEGMLSASLITAPREGTYNIGYTLQVDTTVANQSIRSLEIFNNNSSKFRNVIAVDRFFAVNPASISVNHNGGGSRSIRLAAGAGVNLKTISADPYTIIGNSTGTYTKLWVTEEGSPTVFEDSTASVDTNLYLPMLAGRECIVDLWVF